LIFPYTTRFTGPILDAMVMILGNVDFMNWMKAQITKIHSKFKIVHEINISKNQEINNNQEITDDQEIKDVQEIKGNSNSIAVIQMEELHLTPKHLCGTTPSLYSTFFFSPCIIVLLFCCFVLLFYCVIVLLFYCDICLL
jgi:hypothetical protein